MASPSNLKARIKCGVATQMLGAEWKDIILYAMEQHQAYPISAMMKIIMVHLAITIHWMNIDTILYILL